MRRAARLLHNKVRGTLFAVYLFKKSRKSGMFCSTNIEKLFQSEGWEKIFQKLSLEHIRAQQQNKTDVVDSVAPDDSSDLDVTVDFMGIGAQGADTLVSSQKCYEVLARAVWSLEIAKKFISGIPIGTKD